jgi:ubiquinol-cytochrome c reductase cytochrome b subunit
LRCGISAPPIPGQVVDPKMYDAEYHEELKTGVPFFGDALLKDILFSALAVIVVVAIAAYLGPVGPTGPANPTMNEDVRLHHAVLPGRSGMATLP